MAVGAGKTGVNIGSDQFYREFGSHDSTAQTKDIDVIILHALVRGEGVVTGGGADATEFVGGHASAGAASTNQGGTLRRAG